MNKNIIENTWFRDQNKLTIDEIHKYHELEKHKWKENNYKKEIITIATQLIEQGLEIIQLVLNNHFIDYSFRAEKLNQILNAFKTKE